MSANRPSAPSAELFCPFISHGFRSISYNRRAPAILIQPGLVSVGYLLPQRLGRVPPGGGAGCARSRARNDCAQLRRYPANRRRVSALPGAYPSRGPHPARVRACGADFPNRLEAPFPAVPGTEPSPRPSPACGAGSPASMAALPNRRERRRSPNPSPGYV